MVFVNSSFGGMKSNPMLNPELAPDNKNKLLSSNSVVKDISYNSEKIEYQTYDSVSTEIFRLNCKPTRIFVDDQALRQ